MRILKGGRGRQKKRVKREMTKKNGKRLSVAGFEYGDTGL